MQHHSCPSHTYTCKRYIILLCVMLLRYVNVYKHSECVCCRFLYYHHSVGTDQCLGKTVTLWHHPFLPPRISKVSLLCFLILCSFYQISWCLSALTSYKAEFECGSNPVWYKLRFMNSKHWATTGSSHPKRRWENAHAWGSLLIILILSLDMETTWDVLCQCLPADGATVISAKNDVFWKMENYQQVGVGAFHYGI